MHSFSCFLIPPTKWYNDKVADRGCVFAFLHFAKGVQGLDGFDVVTCRLAIQVCIGQTPGGRPSHRTFSIKGIKPDADMAALASLVRLIAPILAYPITKVRLVTKKVFRFSGASEESQEDAASPAAPLSDASPSGPAETSVFAAEKSEPIPQAAAVLWRAFRAFALAFLPFFTFRSPTAIGRPNAFRSP